ncbi:hypothetical protein AAGG74_18095 [Bacillus mexicanus]|uniref:hypothetical protein n=1 Tax=Bacillus mexicanus TaxID=2834415 RepID=UPI003D224F98
MKYWKTFYFIAVSLLIYGCVLSLGKGFDVIKVLNTTLGEVYLFALFIATFVYMFFVGRKKQQTQKIRFENLNIDKELFEAWVSNVIKCDEKSKNISIEYEISEALESKVLTVQLNVLDLEAVNVGDAINEIKEKFDKSLKSHFDGLLKEEIKIEFEIIKKKENVLKQKEEEVSDKTEKQ